MKGSQQWFLKFLTKEVRRDKIPVGVLPKKLVTQLKSLFDPTQFGFGFCKTRVEWQISGVSLTLLVIAIFSSIESLHKLWLLIFHGYEVHHIFERDTKKFLKKTFDFI